jgi:hypothetical protein
LFCEDLIFYVYKPYCHLYDLFFRDVVELKEAIRIKEAEGDAYISDIEVNLLFFFLINTFF